MTDNEMQEQWNRMVENMNQAVAESVEQNMDAQARFMEAWAETMDQSMPDEDAMEDSLESYNAAYSVWMDAADRMFERLTDAAEGEDVAVTEFRDIWLQSANEAFKEVMGTTAFAAATGNVVESMMELQREAEDVSQDTLTRMGLPTRDDMDEVGERLIELERRQHAVEKKLDRVLEHLEE
ncbi:poly(R)-hydroxyalkanoic acid synthase subunit PhaE [Natronomonas sp. EA1]|uniref:poly(R)-hydroxyalkanoic acid synthase subunit PhaE n=1 Tax=Natronomonas sp. EA1 TaxID=3421655 RepID=UPI003EBED140